MSQTAKGRSPHSAATIRACESVASVAETVQDADQTSAEHSFEFASNGVKVDLLELIDFLTNFQKIDRQIYIPALERNENDTEHSYNLTMAVLLIATKEEFPLDANLAIKYALVHDLVEVYAGDTSALDDEQIRTKAAREHVALQRLKSNELTAGIAGMIEEYESLDNEESRFVYGLDKLMAAYTIVHGQISIWQEHGITRTIWQERFQAKVQTSPYLQPYLEALLQLFEDNPGILAD